MITITKLNALTAAYLADKQALSTAQAAERDARRALHESSGAIATALEADGADQIGSEFVWAVNDRMPPEPCLIVGVRCQPYSAAELNPVVVVKTKAGDWGKTKHCLYKIIFNHETREWVRQ